MTEEFDEEFYNAWHEHPYEHAVFQPGQMVMISEHIREIHEHSPLAGKHVMVTTGAYPSSDLPLVQQALDYEEAQEPHNKKVPVLFEGNLFFVEEAYIF